MAAKHIKNKLSAQDNIPDFEMKDIKIAINNDVDYSRFRKKMSQVASFKRDYEGCVSLLDEVNAALCSYPKEHRSLADYYLDRDMLTSMKALLEAIVSEGPEAGSRGGAIFRKDGKTIKENRYYRDYLTVTKDGQIEYLKVSPVPYEQNSFEAYLREISEG